MMDRKAFRALKRRGQFSDGEMALAVAWAATAVAEPASETPKKRAFSTRTRRKEVPRRSKGQRSRITSTSGRVTAIGLAARARTKNTKQVASLGLCFSR